MTTFEKNLEEINLSEMGEDNSNERDLSIGLGLAEEEDADG